MVLYSTEHCGKVLLYTGLIPVDSVSQTLLSAGAKLGPANYFFEQQLNSAALNLHMLQFIGERKLITARRGL